MNTDARTRLANLRALDAAITDFRQSCSRLLMAYMAEGIEGFEAGDTYPSSLPSFDEFVPFQTQDFRVLPDVMERAEEDARREAILDEARDIGREAGIAAAGWTTDGNTSADHARRMVAMLDAGDPEVYDHLPRTPNLSGEFADDPTPRTLARDLGVAEEGDLIDEACSAWEDAASEAFHHEAERLLRIAAGEEV